MAKMKGRTAKGQKYMKADPQEEFASDLEDGEEEEGASSEEEAGPQPGVLREPIYDVDGMHEKLEDISWVEDASWEDAQVITAADEIHIENIDDDLERELAFYNQALVASHAAIAKFEAAGMPWRRPTDYYAEMVKTDTHMARVKQQLMHEQKQIELAEERRKQREQKQFSKQVQAEKLKQKQQDKKKQISDISKMRKQRDKSGYEGEADFDAMINNQGAASSRGKGKMQDRNRPGASGPANKKRQGKDAKFGFGGKKRIAKQNDASSAADMSGYKGAKGGKGGKGGPFKPKGGVKKAGAAKQRPGKARRQQMRSKT